MKKMLKKIRTWLNECKQEAENRKTQKLYNDAAERVVMRRIKYIKEVDGVGGVQCTGFGIFVCGNLVAESAKANTEFTDKLFELRQKYYELHKDPSAYTLL